MLLELVLEVCIKPLPNRYQDSLAALEFHSPELPNTDDSNQLHMLHTFSQVDNPEVFFIPTRISKTRCFLLPKQASTFWLKNLLLRVSV